MDRLEEPKVITFDQIPTAENLEAPRIMRWLTGDTIRMILPNLISDLRIAADSVPGRVHKLESPPNENFPYKIVFIANRDLIKKIMHLEININSDKHGFVGKGETIKLSTPILGESGVFNIEKGKLWRALRDIVGENFKEIIENGTLDRITIVETLKVISRWDGRNIDIRHDIEEITLNVVWKVLLGVDRDPSDLKRLSKIMKEGLNYLISNARLPGILKKLDLRTRKFAGIIEEIDTHFAEIINSIKDKDLTDRIDTLSVLLADADKELEKLKEEGIIENNAFSNERVVKENALVLFFAGHETTTIVTNWVLYFLGKSENHQWQNMFDNGDEEMKDALVDAFVREGLRLKAPTVAMPRDVFQDFTIEHNECIYEFTKGTLLMFCFPDSMRDPALFDETTINYKDQFSPGVYLPGSEVRRKMISIGSSAYGMGERRCLGADPADVILRVMIKLIMEKFRFENTRIKDAGSDGELAEFSGPSILREPGRWKMSFQSKIPSVEG